jgi:hypothetical protein
MSSFNAVTADELNAGHKTQRFVVIAGFALTGGMILVSIVLAFSGPAGESPQLGVALTSFLVYTASITVGVFLGFLFGLPRARVIDQLTVPQAAEAGSATGEKQSPSQAPWQTQFLTNSNLIKVSDWLTTIIIGLTLVNLGQVVPAIRDLGSALSAPLGGFAFSAAVGVTVSVGSLLAGFLLGYMWTSIRVRELLEEAELRARLMNESGRQLMVNLKGKTVDQARSLAALGGFDLEIPAKARGTSKIVDQDRRPGAELATGDTVKVEIG